MGTFQGIHEESRIEYKMLQSPVRVSVIKRGVFIMERLKQLFPKNRERFTKHPNQKKNTFEQLNEHNPKTDHSVHSYRSRVYFGSKNY